MKNMSLVAAIREYFGFLPGQTPMQFMAEIKELTAEDREYFKREFVKVGYAIT
jgi:hypothetical protein